MVTAKQELNWRAESDAHTLIEAQKIQSDLKRKKLALAQITKIEKEVESTLQTVKKVKSKPTTKRRK